MFSKLFWLAIIALAMTQASQAQDKADEDKMVQSALSTHYADSFDDCMAAYLALHSGPIDFKMITFCKQISKGRR